MFPLIDIEDFKVSFSLLWIRDDTPFLGKVTKGVILLVPIFNTSKRCWKVWERAIYRLDPLPEKVIFCENNSSDNTLELINNFQLPHEVIRVWFRSDATKGPLREYEGIANVRQLLLTRARRPDVKMAIFLDDDCIPQDRNFIQRFLDDNLDICGGTYTRDFPEGTFVASKWHISEPIENMPSGDNPIGAKGIAKTIEGAKKNNLPMLVFLYENFTKEKIYKVTVTSGGALALSQKVLQDRQLNFIPIRHDLSEMKEVSEDFGYCLLARSLGYQIFLDFRIKFAHLGAMSNETMKNRPWATYVEEFKY